MSVIQLKENLVVICGARIADAYDMYDRLDQCLCTYLPRHRRSVVSDFDSRDSSIANASFASEMILVPAGNGTNIPGEPRKLHKSVSYRNSSPMDA